MCSVNRVNSEPPSHRDCAMYAMRACPFLSQPRMRRNEKDLPGGTIAGIHLAHNPGAMLVWTTHDYKPFRAGEGVLFKLGEPVELAWYAEGRKATRAEVLAAFDRGLGKLRGIAAQEGKAAMRELQKNIDLAMKYVPVEDRDAGPL
jgi:hypothetical protein